MLGKFALKVTALSYKLGFGIKSVPTHKDSIFTVSLIGRPNVGKSTLFNRLAGTKLALTDNTPGLTRDRKEVITDILGYPIRVVDTAGWEMTKVNEVDIRKKMKEQTANALIYSDLALLLFDVREGITENDLDLSRWLKKNIKIPKSMPNPENQPVIPSNQTVKRIILVGNKAESGYDYSDVYNEVYQLGYGEPMLISAEHGDGMHELLKEIDKEVPTEQKKAFEDKKAKRVKRFEEIKAQLKRDLIKLRETQENPDDIDIEEWEKEFDKININPEENSDLDSDSEVDPLTTLTTEAVNTKTGIQTENLYSRRPIQVSIVGKPNVGKSTFVNSFLQDDRVIADDLAGTTRDAISIQWVYKGRKIVLVDTAGITRRSSSKSALEKKIEQTSLATIRYSHVVICLIDALEAFRVQDMNVIQHVIEEGRGVVLVVNKWDLVVPEWRARAMKFMRKQVEKSLGSVKSVPLHFISALQKRKVDAIMDEVLQVYEKWNIRISTGMLNDWLQRFLKVENLPSDEGDKLKIKFITQVKTRPPTFVIFVNSKRLFKTNYMKFMKTNLTTEFGLTGVPVRILVRDTTHQKVKRRLEIRRNNRRMKKMSLRRNSQYSLAKEKLAKLKSMQRLDKNSKVNS